MDPGMNGQLGVPALRPAPMEQCSARESVTVHRTEAPSAEETGANPAAASSETAQVSPRLIEVDGSLEDLSEIKNLWHE